MIDRQVLLDMGFRKAEGWGSEVYYHDSDYWVHYDDQADDSFGFISKSSSDMKTFYAKFIDHLIKSTEDKFING